ncbi:hypothetical protein NSQ43_16020 [Sporosarcina sp. FSL W8-0480]|uniref:hypothetical protein n=1 Tax=Sporosarcina sp. FSL W8-0480 TaxID=2954701 RepID=UPI0030D8AC8B
MKKKLIISLSALMVIALCVGGYLLYIIKFKEYDVADESIDEIIEESFEIELPDGTIITLDDSGEDIVKKESDKEHGDEEGQDSSDSTTDDSEDESSIPVSGKDQSSKTPSGTSNSGSNSNSNTNKGSGSTSKPATGNSTAGPGNTGTKVTVASIKEKYNPAFNALENQAESKLNALIGRAKNEYLTKKENGEKIDYGYFYNKYTSAAAELEGRTDSVFKGVLKVVEKDLEKNGYDKSYAKSFQDQYNAQKKSRKDALMKKVVNR